MIRPEYREALESQHKVLVILWFVFLAGIVLYLWISQRFLTERPSAAEGFFAQASATVLWALAFADVATLVWWRRRFLSRQAILGRVRQYKILQSLQQHNTEAEEQAAGVVSAYVTGKIVVFALVEAVAIYGFALAFVNRDFSSQFILSAAAAALLLFEFPAKRFLAELLRGVESGAVSPSMKTPTAP